VMAREGFFQKIKNFLFGESEEAINEFSQPEEADVSIQDSDISEIPSFKFSPKTEGTLDAPAEFYTAKADVGREVPAIPEQYRVEHEPYRYEPDGDNTVCISKAHLYEIHPKTETCVEMHELKPLQIKADRECVIYSEFSTDEQGKVIADADNQDGALYRLSKAKDLPDSTQFELPDESNSGGKEGKYFIPIVWVKDGKLYRHQWNEETDGREARLYGSLEGIRGPLHWHRGYNKIKNLGGGKNVYKKYVRDGKDEKEFRSINERSQSGLSSPFTGEPQVKVKYNAAQADASEIHVTGNEFNKHWKIDGKGVAVVEDGLVTCLNDLTCVELNETTVISAASGTTVVPTAGSPISVAQAPSATQFTTVLTSAGTVTVSLEPTNSNMATVVSAGAVTTAAAPVTSGNKTEVHGVDETTYKLACEPVTTGNFTSVVATATTTTVAAPVTASNMASVLSSSSTTPVALAPNPASDMVDVWHDGISSAGGGLLAVKVQGCGSDDNCYWVLAAAAATGAFENSPPTFPSFITGASLTSVVKSLSTTNVVDAGSPVSVVQSVPTTTVLNSTTPVDVVQSIPTTNFVSEVTTVTSNVVTSTTGVSVLSSGSTVSVVASLPTTAVATAGNTVQVVKDLTPVTVVNSTNTVEVLMTGTTVDVYAPTGGLSEPIKVVECPTSSLCP